jgi:phosphate transport system substrate-binding protein
MLTAAAVIGAAFTGCSREKGKKIVIKGSTTVLPITQKAAEEYRKTSNTAISIEGSGSGNGIKALIDGTCDIANSSRKFKDEEIKAARAKNVSYREIPVAYDMIVPVVHPSNPVNNLTMEQLKAIYDGSVNNWKELGGRDGKIVVISRDSSSGTFEVWHEKVQKKTDVRKDALLQASNGAIITSVAANPLAIGYAGFGYLTSSVKAIKVNSVEGTIENGKSGSFPLARELYICINEKTVSKEAMDFVNFLLGPAGQKCVQDAKYIPL